MTDIKVLPLQLDLLASELELAARSILASASKLDRTTEATFVNDADPTFDAATLARQRSWSLDNLSRTSQDVRTLGNFVQLTRDRMVAADNGGSTATTDPIPGPLLRPGIGFGSEGPVNASVWWLDAYAAAGVAHNAPRIQAVGPALGGAARNPRAINTALAGIVDDVPGAATRMADGLRRATPHARSAAQRAAATSPWADEAIRLGGRFADDAARGISVASSSSVVSKVGTYGGPALSAVGAVVDGHTAVTAFRDDDIEKSTIYAVRALGGAMAVAPGGQVIGLSLVGATYVVEYREELWGSVMSTLEFGKDPFQ